MIGPNNHFNYVFNYTDHLGNIRLSYGLDENNVLKILEENNYYPFGLKHNNYNVDRRRYEETILGVEIRQCDVCPRGYQYKYNGKELQDELGLNLYDYGARNYDPALGRWMNIDPLAETSRRFSPYVYALNNPVYFIDPDGMEADDWINWKGHDGKQHITYDPKIKTLQQAKEKGYSTATQVFSAGRGNNGRATEEFHFQQGGKFSVNGGKVMDVANGIYTAEGGSIIDINKSGVEQISAVGQGIGDGITAIGLATLNPAIAGAGEAISNTFLGVEVIDNLMTEGISKETVIDNGVKVGLSVGFGELGKAGVKGTQTVAGEVAVKAGENMVSESIIKATTTAGQKAAEKIIEDKRK
jgi:RHS repeat-associated protein